MSGFLPERLATHDRDGEREITLHLPAGHACFAGHFSARPIAPGIALLLSFARTLREGPPLVEQLARATHPELSPSEIEHCRSVTWLWCAFFAANATAIGGLALWAPRAWWAAYAGFGSYLAVGFLFASEYVVRRARFGRFEDHLLDRALARALGRPRVSS